MLKLHENGVEEFDSGCVAYLGKAVNVTLEKTINDVEYIRFDYPCTDEQAALIKENMIVSHDGQGYVITRVTRKTDGQDIKSVVAADLFSVYGLAKHIQNIPDMIGVKPSEVFEQIITGTRFKMFTEAELKERGMTWIDNDENSGEYLIDFFSTDKTNVFDATLTLVENCGKGEIYRENFKAAIVNKIGADNGVRLTLEKNMDGLQIESDLENTITRLYPYGADDIHIGSVNNGVQYIESPNTSKYGIREGYKDYSDYTDPEKIKEHALWEFDEKNEDRIDVPKISITGGFIDLAKLPEFKDTEKVDIGDTVYVYDNDHNVYRQRIVAITTYPYEPKMPTIQIGHIARNTFSVIYNLCQRRRELENVQTANKSIATRKVQGTVNTDRNGVQSENELLQIKGDLLTICDEERVRIKLGNDEGEFVFIIYDKRGRKAICLNEYGEAVFSGSIDTKKDATVGSVLYLQTTELAGSSREPAIRFLNEAGEAVGEISCTKEGYIRIFPLTDNGTVLAANSELALKDDIASLQKEIEELKAKLTKD